VYFACSAVTRTELGPGDNVFVRWQGTAEFEIMSRHICDSPMPHWVCRTWGGRRHDYWIIPQIHMATTNIESLIQDHNKK